MQSLPPIALRRIAELLGKADATALVRSCTRIWRAFQAQQNQLARRTHATRSGPHRPTSAPRSRPGSACIAAPAQSMLEAARAPRRDYRPVRETSPTREQVYRQPYLLPPSDAEVAFSLQREAFRSAGDALRSTDPSGVAGAFHARVNRIARAAAAHELLSPAGDSNGLLTAAVPMQRVRFVQMRRLVPREDPAATAPSSSPRTAKLKKGFTRPSSAAAARAAVSVSAGTPARPASASATRAAPRPTVKPFFFVSPAPRSSSSAASARARVRSRPAPEGLGEGGIHGGGFATSPLLDPSVPAPRLLLNQPSQQDEKREDDDDNSSDEDDPPSAASLLGSAAAGARPPRHSLHSVPLHGLQEMQEEEAEADMEAESALETALRESEQIAAMTAAAGPAAAEVADSVQQQSHRSTSQQQLHSSSHHSLHSASLKSLSLPLSPEHLGPNNAAGGDELLQLAQTPAAESAPLPNLHADHAFSLQIAQLNLAEPLSPEPLFPSRQPSLQPTASSSRPPSSAGSQSARARRPAVRTPDSHSAASSARAVTHRSPSGATFSLSGLLGQVAGTELFDPSLRARAVPVFTRRLVQLNHQRRQRALEAAKAAQADRHAQRIAAEVALVDRTWESYAQRKHHIEEDFAAVQRAVMRKQMERALQQQIAMQEREIARLHSAAPHELELASAAYGSSLEDPQEEEKQERSYEMPYVGRSAGSRPSAPLPHSHAASSAVVAPASSESGPFFLSDPTRLALGAPVDLAAASTVLPRPAGVAYYVPRELVVAAPTKSRRAQRDRAAALAARRRQLQAQCAAHKDRFALISQTQPTAASDSATMLDRMDDASPPALPSSLLAAESLPACTSPYLNRTAVRFDGGGRWDRPRDRPEQERGGILRANPPQMASAYFDVHWPTDRK